MYGDGNFAEIISNTGLLDVLFQGLLEECEHFSFAVAWATCGFHACKSLLNPTTKIRHAVVGTHFFQTDANFIRAFIGSDRTKFVFNTICVFRPKVYVFEHEGGEWDCLVGSANFTGGGFGKNAEVMIHFNEQDDKRANLLKALKSQILDSWKNGRVADDIDIDHYQYLQALFKRTSDRAHSFLGGQQSSKNVDKIELLFLDWGEFRNRVARLEEEPLQNRLNVLDAARCLFSRDRSLSRMASVDCKGIGGYAETDEIHWKCFGSMAGAGIFMKMMNTKVNEMSAALDHVPANGPVSKEHYEEYITNFVAAFPFKKERRVGHGLATATRLLCMKRPDHFVCLDDANRNGLCNEFGITLRTKDYEGYWNSIIEPIRDSKWWNSRRPDQKEKARFWDSRVALLDNIFYMRA